MFYAGIGSRTTPYAVRMLMMKLGYWLAKDGYTLRSGGAYGADQAFEEGCDAAGGEKQIFTAKSDIPDWAFETVSKYHPNPAALSAYVNRLHARNAMIIKDVQFITCWTPSARITGGTGQALRIAKDWNIPVRNLADRATLDKAMKYIREKEEHNNE